ncbi:TetR family transcriptional regulator [bacterium]|nr:TetR family transcriptional regulator [bacterium]
MPAHPLRRPARADADGRARRAHRSGEAIVAALYDLIGEGVLDPTAQQVAERARVGIRTVFRRFSDKERLFAEMDARLTAEALPLLRDAAPQGGIDARAAALVERRAVFFERIAPYKRAGNLKRWRSPFLAERHGHLVTVLRGELLRWLPELRRAPAALVDALELATSFEAWDRLRGEQRLAATRARAVVERTVLALLRDLAP